MSSALEQTYDEFLPEIPTSFQPDSRHMLPTFTIDQYRALAERGFDGIGVAHVVAETGKDPRVMLFKHRESGLLGLLSETVKCDGITVEDPLSTSARAFSEELEISDVPALDLSIPRQGGWIGFSALRRRLPPSYLAGIGYPLFTNSVSLEEIAEQAQPTSEVSDCFPVALEDVFRIDDFKLRPFAKPALQKMIDAGLLSTKVELDLVSYQPPAVSQLFIMPDFTPHDLPVSLRPATI